MGGGATVVERFDDGVQMNVGAVQMIHICDVLMNLVDVVGLSRFGVCRMSVVGVVQMILVFDAGIPGVGWLMQLMMFEMMNVCLCFCFCGMLACPILWTDVYVFVDDFGLHFPLVFHLFGVCVFR